MNGAINTQEKGLVREEQILMIAKTLFAQNGFDSVSMRDLAKAIGITPPALYHYFPTKQSLQVATLVAAHNRLPAASLDDLEVDGLQPEEKLYRFVYRLARRYHEDPDFLALVGHAILSPDAELQQTLLDVVLRDNFIRAEALLSTLAPHFDSHLLTEFIFSLVMHTYSTRRLRRNFPGYRPQHDEPEYVAQHVVKLLRGDMWKLSA